MFNFEKEAIEGKFSHVKINHGESDNMIKHGNLIRIGKETNCNYYICHFEYGNEFVQKSSFARIVEEFVKKHKLA